MSHPVSGQTGSVDLTFITTYQRIGCLLVISSAIDPYRDFLRLLVDKMTALARFSLFPSSKQCLVCPTIRLCLVIKHARMAWHDNENKVLLLKCVLHLVTATSS